GLEDLCLTLEGQDAAGLVAPGLGVTLRRGGAARATPARARRPVADGAPHVGFVVHLAEAADLARWDPRLAALEPEACDALVERMSSLVDPVVIHRDQVSSRTGARTDLTVVGLAVPSTRFARALCTPPARHALSDLVRRAVALAAAQGCSVVGLGG